MVRQPSGEARDTLLRLRLLKTGRLRGDGGERNSRPPIPVVVSARSSPRPPELGPRPPSALVTVPRQIDRLNAQTTPDVPRPPDGTGAAKVWSKSVIELLNSQSLLPKLPDIRAELLHKHTDMLCYTETNLKNSTPDRLISLHDYRILRQDRIIGRKKSGGGVALFVRENYYVDKLVINQHPSTSSNVEILWAKVKLDNRRAVVVECVYRPPSTSTSQVNNDYDDIEEQLQTVISAHSSLRIILAGDLNSDDQTNPLAYARLQELERYDLRCVVHQPTFYRGNTRSVLDVVLMSRELCEDMSPPSCIIERCDFTAHHRRVIITTSVARTKLKPRYRTGRNWRVLDRDSFLADVRCTDWGAVVRRDDLCERQWECFTTEMNRILNEHVPVRKYRIHNPSPPPVSDETLDLMRQRRYAKIPKDTESYKQLNKVVRQAEAIPKDARDAIAQRVAGASPSSLYRQLQPAFSNFKYCS